MKYIVILVTLVSLFSCKDIHDYKPDHLHSETYIDPILKPYVEEFKEDCIKHGWDPNHINGLDEIIFGDLEEMEEKHLQGVCSHWYDVVKLNPKLYKEGDTVGLKHVLYHELGHWYGEEHGRGIMSSNYSDGNTYYNDWDEAVRFMMEEDEVEGELCSCGGYHIGKKSKKGLDN